MQEACPVNTFSAKFFFLFFSLIQETGRMDLGLLLMNLSLPQLMFFLSELKIADVI